MEESRAQRRRARSSHSRASSPASDYDSDDSRRSRGRSTARCSRLQLSRSKSRGRKDSEEVRVTRSQDGAVPSGRSGRASIRKKSTTEPAVPMEVALPNPCVRDHFCWICHKGDADLTCATCPRNHHLKCIGLDSRPDEGKWICEECVVEVRSDQTDNRSWAMRQVTVPQLGKMLKLAVLEMELRVPEPERFQRPVSLEHYPDYLNHIFNPMDLSKLASNIDKNLYGSPAAFLADAKWILHNSMIFNEAKSEYNATAKKLINVCKQDMAEIENCPECYLRAHTQADWFPQVCSVPHLLVWAKVPHYPHWPAKVMKYHAKQREADCRFFGDHDKSLVKLEDVFLYSNEPPNNATRGKSPQLEKAMRECREYINNLAEKYALIELAPPNIGYVPEVANKQLRLLIPSYRAAGETEAEVQAEVKRENLAAWRREIKHEERKKAALVKVNRPPKEPRPKEPRPVVPRPVEPQPRVTQSELKAHTDKLLRSRASDTYTSGADGQVSQHRKVTAEMKRLQITMDDILPSRRRSSKLDPAEAGLSPRPVNSVSECSSDSEMSNIRIESVRSLSGDDLSVQSNADGPGGPKVLQAKSPVNKTTLRVVPEAKFVSKLEDISTPFLQKLVNEVKSGGNLATSKSPPLTFPRGYKENKDKSSPFDAAFNKVKNSSSVEIVKTYSPKTTIVDHKALILAKAASLSSFTYRKIAPKSDETKDTVLPLAEKKGVTLYRTLSHTPQMKAKSVQEVTKLTATDSASLVKTPNLNAVSNVAPNPSNEPVVHANGNNPVNVKTEKICTIMNVIEQDPTVPKEIVSSPTNGTEESLNVLSSAHYAHLNTGYASSGTTDEDVFDKRIPEHGYSRISVDEKKQVSSESESEDSVGLVLSPMRIGRVLSPQKRPLFLELEARKDEEAVKKRKHFENAVKAAPVRKSGSQSSDDTRRSSVSSESAKKAVEEVCVDSKSVAKNSELPNDSLKSEPLNKMQQREIMEIDDSDNDTSKESDSEILKIADSDNMSEESDSEILKIDDSKSDSEILKSSPSRGHVVGSTESVADKTVAMDTTENADVLPMPSGPSQDNSETLTVVSEDEFGPRLFSEYPKPSRMDVDDHNSSHQISEVSSSPPPRGVSTILPPADEDDSSVCELDLRDPLEIVTEEESMSSTDESTKEIAKQHSNIETETKDNTQAQLEDLKSNEKTTNTVACAEKEMAEQSRIKTDAIDTTRGVLAEVDVKSTRNEDSPDVVACAVKDKLDSMKAVVVPTLDKLDSSELRKETNDDHEKEEYHLTAKGLDSRSDKKLTASRDDKEKKNECKPANYLEQSLDSSKKATDERMVKDKVLGAMLEAFESVADVEDIPQPVDNPLLTKLFQRLSSGNQRGNGSEKDVDQTPITSVDKKTAVRPQGTNQEVRGTDQMVRGTDQEVGVLTPDNVKEENGSDGEYSDSEQNMFEPNVELTVEPSSRPVIRVKDFGRTVNLTGGISMSVIPCDEATAQESRQATSTHEDDSMRELEVQLAAWCRQQTAAFSATHLAAKAHSLAQELKVAHLLDMHRGWLVNFKARHAVITAPNELVLSVKRQGGNELEAPRAKARKSCSYSMSRLPQTPRPVTSDNHPSPINKLQTQVNAVPGPATRPPIRPFTPTYQQTLSLRPRMPVVASQPNLLSYQPFPSRLNASSAGFMPPSLGPVTIRPSAGVRPALPTSNQSAASVTQDLQGFGQKMFAEFAEKFLQDLAHGGNQEAAVCAARLNMERDRWHQENQLRELSHNFNLAMVERSNSFEHQLKVMRDKLARAEREKNVAVEEAVRETKKKQWCVSCHKEALLYCCWNTSFCGLKCQRLHWEEHQETCQNPHQSQHKRQEDRLIPVSRPHDLIPVARPIKSPISVIGQKGELDVLLSRSIFPALNHTVTATQSPGVTAQSPAQVPVASTSAAPAPAPVHLMVSNLGGVMTGYLGNGKQVSFIRDGNKYIQVPNRPSVVEKPASSSSGSSADGDERQVSSPPDCSDLNTVLFGEVNAPRWRSLVSTPESIAESINSVIEKFIDEPIQLD